MSDLYTSLHVSPRKKRCPPSDDEDSILTPKKIRTMPRTPVSTRKSTATLISPLPSHLARFQTIQTSLHQALSHSLATSAVSPSESGIVPNVLNNHTLTAAAGLSRTCTLDDLRRLCWLWEWDGKKIPHLSSEEENPFMEASTSKTEVLRQWTRGGMGIIISPTSHLAKAGGKRVPAYGIGIEVEMNIDKGMTGGMAAIARWTATSEERMKKLAKKLHRWVELHEESETIPPLPLADLPRLVQQHQKQSTLTQRLTSLSPKSPKQSASESGIHASLQTPSSPSRPSSPTKPRVTPGKRTTREFAIPFPITPISLSRHKSTSSTTTSIPKTPRSIDSKPPCTPHTPATSPSTSDVSRPSTPVNQTGEKAGTVPATPTTSRRAALYERIRKRSESQAPATPSKSKLPTTGLSKDQLLKLGQEEIRRRCLLGRLGGVAESIWMFFASPGNSTLTTASPRKRRTLPSNEVIQAILKSSPVPISSAEALESVNLLTSLCPFFLKQVDVGGEDWLEMPASAGATQPATPSSPGRRRGNASDDELRTLSPKRVKREAGGLREVRERIKKELELAE